uniref:Secretion system C-terminal sorting domain-containing protein n=1 Tax=Prevotella sp. GTC17262 TaxID=3236797 RepID=A0AB33JRV6_9BACT
MKRFYLSLLSLVGIFSWLGAQDKLLKTTNRPRPTDRIVKQQVEYKHPGKSGTHVFWNFSEQNTVNPKYNIDYGQLRDAADTIIRTEHQTNYYYILRGDSLMLSGYENQTTRMHYTKPELLLHFPLAYGDSIGSYYHGTGKYCGKLDMASSGLSYSVADAYGLLILPGGDTLKHVIRVHTTKFISEKVQVLSEQDTLQADSLNRKILSDQLIQEFLNNDTTILQEDIYRWYATGYRYPIFETVIAGGMRAKGKTTYFSTAFYYPPNEQSYLADDAENRKIQELLRQEDARRSGNGRGKDARHPMEDELHFRYNFYPNPVRTTLSFEYYISDEAEVSYDLFGLSGILVCRRGPERVQGGAHEYRIDMSQLAAGTYILRVRVNEATYSERIIKR